MKSRKISPMAFAAVYALVAPLAVGLLASPGILKLLQGREAAAWVQAVGSIVAIVASVLIALWVDASQSRRLRREREQARLELLEVLVELSEDAVISAEQMVDDIRRDLRYVAEYGTRALGDLDEIVRAVEAIDVQSLNSAAAYRIRLKLLQGCRSATTLHDNAMASWRSSSGLHPNLDEELSGWPENLSRIRDYMRLLRDHRAAEAGVPVG